MTKRAQCESFKRLDRLAHDTSDIRPLTPDMRRQWGAAKRMGAKPGKAGRGRPRKEPGLKSRIVPISIDPALLAEVDRFAKAVGITRSRLVAEGLRLRMK